MTKNEEVCVEYRKTFDISNSKETLTQMVEMLSPLGFHIADNDGFIVRVRGPGKRSTKRNPLFGIGLLELESSGQSIDVRATIDQVGKLWITILASVFLPMLLVVSLIPIFVREQGVKSVGLLAIWGNILVWILILPFIIRLQKRRAIRALEKMILDCGGRQ